MSSKDKKKQIYFDKTWLKHEDFSLDGITTKV